jgi:hypothetical protein
MSNGEKAGRVAQVFGVQLQNKFLLEQFRFRFLLTTVCFIQISVFAFLYVVSDIFMSAFQMELNDYPPLRPRRGWDTVFHGPTLSGVPESAIRRIHPSWLRWVRFGLPLPTVHGSQHGPV